MTSTQVREGDLCLGPQPGRGYKGSELNKGFLVSAQGSLLSLNVRKCSMQSVSRKPSSDRHVK